MLSLEAVLERPEIISSNEIPLKELTYHRLEKQYQFIADSLIGLSEDIGRPLEILDVGTWRGDYIHFFTDLPKQVVGHVTAIDISKRKVEQAQEQPCLQGDLASGRLEIMQGDGTNMPEFPNESFDFVNNIEILVGLKGGENSLISEVNRVLAFNGRTSFNIPDQQSAYLYQQMGEFTAKKKIRLSQEELRKMITDNFDGDARIAWFGQMAIREDDENTLLPFRKGSRPGHIVLARDALSVRSVYSLEGNKQFDPYFWMPLVRKWR